MILSSLPRDVYSPDSVCVVILFLTGISS